MRIIIIGAGKIVSWFLKDIVNSKYHKDISVVGIYNRTLAKVQTYQSQYQIKNVYETLKQVIANKTNYDLAYVGTSDETHYEITKQLLSNNINVYCEKPLAINYVEAQELYKLANKNHVLLFDGIKTGFSPAYQAMKKDINDGIIGTIQYLNVSHAKVSTSGKVPNPTKQEKIVGFHFAGGMYALFMSLDLLGTASTISYLNNSYPHNSAIATSVLNIRHQNQGISTVLGSDTLTNDLSSVILGTKGYIKLGGNLKKYHEDYKKDNCHMAYTYEVYNLKNQVIKTVDLGFKTDGEGLCCTIDHVYELLKNKQTMSPIITKQISLTIIKILSLTNNVNDKNIIKLK